MFTITVDENTVYQKAERYMDNNFPNVSPDDYELDLETQSVANPDNFSGATEIHFLNIYTNGHLVKFWFAPTLLELAEKITW